MTRTLASQCGICGPAMPSHLDEIVAKNHLTQRHGHRLFLILGGTTWRFWWATRRDEIEPELRRRRSGDGTLPIEIRPARFADVVRQRDCGGVR